jgi:hypothetical protein
MTPPSLDGRGQLSLVYPPPMSDIIFLTPPENIPDLSTGVCDCGNDTFHTLFSEEDPETELCHLIALQCSDCGQELRANEHRYDA